jgi:hypothetical protein
MTVVNARIGAVAILLSCVTLPSPRGIAAQAGAVQSLALFPGAVDLVQVSGSRAYLIAGPKLTILDVSNPAAPRVAGEYTFPERIFAVRVSGNHVYAAVDFQGLAVLDVSNPAMPAPLGTVKLPGQAVGLDLSGSRVMVVNRISGLEVFDISNPARPVQIGAHYADGYALDVAAVGSVALVVDYPNGLIVVDTSAPGEPKELGVIAPQEKPVQVAVGQFTSKAGKNVTIACVVGESGLLQLYDVSNPAAVVRIGTYTTPGPPLTPILATAAGLRVSMRGSLAYVARGPAGLQILDLSDPAKPALVGTYPTAGAARDAIATDTHIFVALAEARGVAPAAAKAAPANRGVEIFRQKP